jgi:Pectate lyase superfamily protein
MSKKISKRELFSKHALSAGALALLAQRASADTPFTSFPFTATGAPTPRTMPDRLGEIKNVKDYGAVGNGVTDDTAAIQACFDAAFGATGHGESAYLNRPVFIPAGQYRITAPLTIVNTKGGHVFGSGMSTTKIINTNSKNPSVIVTNGIGYCTFEEMYLAASPGGIAFDYDWNGSGQSGQLNLFKHIFFQGGAYGCRVGFSNLMCDTSTWLSCFFASATTAGLAVLNLNSVSHNIFGGNFQDNAIGIFVSGGGINAIIGTGFQLSSQWDIKIAGGALDTYLIAGVKTESANFFAGTNASMSFNLVGCAQLGVHGGTGTFASAYGALNIDGCWSEAGRITSGGQTTTKLAMRNNKWGTPPGSETPDLSLFHGTIIDWPLQATLFADLPSTPFIGMEANISDATVNTFGAAVTAGGGTNNVKIRYNGKNWTVMGI